MNRTGRKDFLCVVNDSIAAMLRIEDAKLRYGMRQPEVDALLTAAEPRRSWSPL